MIPIQGTAAVLTAPSSPLQTSGYVPGNTLAAQVFNWYLYHLTAEINNVLSGQNLSQSTLDDSQLLKAVGRTNLLISTSGTVTTATQFAGNTLTQFANLSGSSNYVITAGAARPGIELIVEALTGSGVMIVNGSGSAFLGSGAVRLLWDGSAWCKIGGVGFVRVFSSGVSQTWRTPWTGTYKCTVTGGGGGGANVTNIGGFWFAGGGGGAGTAIKTAYEVAGTAFTYSVGYGGAAGGSGSASILSDGSVLLSGGGGGSGTVSTSIYSGLGGTAGSASSGDLNIVGQSGGNSYAPGGTNPPNTSGSGGGGFWGPGTLSVTVPINTAANGNNASVPGTGGSGAVTNGTAGNGTGGTGAAGVIVVEF